MGVFRVHNTVADKSLVGVTRDLPSMLNRQRFQLSHGSHPNRPLQEDWNRLGPEAFAFEVLDTLSPPEGPGADTDEDLRLLEHLWRGCRGPPASTRWCAGPRTLPRAGSSSPRRERSRSGCSCRTQSRAGARGRVCTGGLGQGRTT